MTATAEELQTFGQDIYCLDGLQPGRWARGLDVVRQNVYRRIQTPPGSLRGGEDEEDYGIDLLALLGAVVTPTDRAALEGQLRAEILKDVRIEDVAVQVTRTSAPPAAGYTVAIRCLTSEGPFDLTVAVSGVTVSLLNFEAT